MTELERDLRTEIVLAETKAVRERLSDALAELDRYVKQLQEFIDDHEEAS